MFATQKKLTETQAENRRLARQIEELRLESKTEHEKELSRYSTLQDRVLSLEKEKKCLGEQVEDLKAKKKREEENLKHMVKITQEKHEIEQEKKLAQMEKEKDTAVAEVKDSYRDKLEEQLDKRGNEMKGMYTEILERLPTINWQHNSGNKVEKKDGVS